MKDPSLSKTGDADVKNRSNDNGMNPETEEFPQTTSEQISTCLSRRPRDAEIRVTEGEDASKKVKTTVAGMWNYKDQKVEKHPSNSKIFKEIRHICDINSLFISLGDPLTSTSYYFKEKKQTQREALEIYIAEEEGPSENIKNTVEDVCDTTMIQSVQRHLNNSDFFQEILRICVFDPEYLPLMDPRSYILFPEAQYLLKKVLKIKKMLKGFMIRTKDLVYRQILHLFIHEVPVEEVLDFNGGFWMISDINEHSFFKEVLLEALFLEKYAEVFQKREIQPKTQRNQQFPTNLRYLQEIQKSQPNISPGEFIKHLQVIHEASQALSKIQEEHTLYVRLTCAYQVAFEFNQIIFIYILRSSVGSKEEIERLRNALFNLEPLERQLREFSSLVTTREIRVCSQKKLARDLLKNVRNLWVPREDFAQSVDIATFTVPPCPLQEFLNSIQGTLDIPIDPFFTSSLSQKLQKLPSIQNAVEALEKHWKSLEIEEDHPLLVETCQIGTSFCWITDDKLVVSAVQENTEKSPNQDAPKSLPIRENEVMAYSKNTSRQGYMILNNKDNGSQFLIFHNNNQAARDDRLLVGSVPRNSNGDFTFDEMIPNWLDNFKTPPK